jgi:hypothetical protein
VALSHLKEEIRSAEGNLTVGPDGTTKLGKHYGAISISLSGKTMCMGQIINRSIPLLLIVCQRLPITNYVWQGLLSPFRHKGYTLLVDTGLEW